MVKRKTEEKEELHPPFFRQCVVTGMDEAITLSSSFPGESMEYLTARAMKMYQKIKTSDKQRW